MHTKDGDALPPVQLDREALEQMRETFLRRIPSFGSFRDRPSLYAQEEREYKEEFFALCRDTLTPARFPLDPTAATAAESVVALRALLTRHLESTGAPQNLLSWRYFDFLRHLDAADRLRFAQAFGDLLFGPGESPERVGRFTAVMWSVWQQGVGGNPYALNRNFPTLFLMALDPERDIAVRSDMFGAAARPFLGGWLLRYQPFGAEDYRRVLSFSAAVLRQLQAWAWRPKDMIDVHSFLWVVTRADDVYSGVTHET